MTSLQDKTISGVFWSLIQKFGAQGIWIIVNIILARLLTPGDFGLIGMLAIFISLCSVLSNAGFSTALIQKLNVDEEDYSSVFYVNLAVSVLLYLILFITAPLIAKFYNQPKLVSLTRVLSLVFVINCFSYVQTTRLQKEVRFKTLMIVHIPSTVIGGIVSITMAFMNFGVWSIVAMQIITNLAYSVQIWTYSKWKPILKFNIKKIKSLFLFGGNIALSDLIHFTYLNIYPVILGRFFPLNTVGYYQTAYKFAMTPSITAMLGLNSVAYPIFSSVQKDAERLKEGFRRGLRQLAFWLCPFFILAGVLAHPLFELVFTEKWISAVPYFRWLCIVAVFVPLSIYSTQIINVMGKSGMYLKLTFLENAILFAGIIFTIPYGINALLSVQAISSVLIYCMNSYFSTMLIGYSIWEQAKDLAPIFLLSMGVGGIIIFIEEISKGMPGILTISLGFVLGALIYWQMSRYLVFSTYKEILSLYRTRIAHRIHI